MIVTTDEIFRTNSRNLLSLNREASLSYSTPGKVTGIVVRLGTSLDKELLSSFENLKFVATITTGLDHIDLKYCESKNIKVISLKDEGAFLNTITATPEHTWGLLLSLMRKVPAANDSVKKHNWDRDSFFGNELASSKLGIIGLGRVGKIVAEYARAFRMQICFYDPYVKDEFPDCEKVSLEELLKTSDVITIHAPLNASTVHLINKDHFSLMLKCPYFVNTSRGKIVKEEDLLWALESKKIKGAALDVLEHELRFKNKIIESPLIDYINSHDNLLITPHIAGSTFESMKKTALFIESKILETFPGC